MKRCGISRIFRWVLAWCACKNENYGGGGGGGGGRMLLVCFYLRNTIGRGWTVRVVRGN